MTKNLTEGSPLKLIWNFAVPLILGNLFQQLYNMVDTVIVGRFLGLSALTSVGASSSILFLITGLYLGVCAGLSIPIAQQFGANNIKRMREYVANAAYLAIGLAIVMTVGTCLLCANILNWLHTPAEIFDGAYAYLFVIFVGIPFSILYNVCAGIIRAMGDSRTPFYFMIMSTALNIVLDIVCIVVFKMGVSGAALATIIAQAAAGISCFIYMKRKYEILKMEPGETRVNTKLIGRMLAIGLPMGLQYSITAIGSTMLQSSVNQLGAIYVSSFTAANKIKFLGICPFEGIGTAVGTFTSQNYGAGKIDRIKQGVKSGLILTTTYSFIMMFVIIKFGTNLQMLYVDASEVEVLHFAQQFLTCSVLFYPFLGMLWCFRMPVQGLGHSAVTMISGVGELFARGIVARIALAGAGWIAVCFADQTAWITAVVACGSMFLYFYRKLKKEHAEI